MLNDALFARPFPSDFLEQLAHDVVAADAGGIGIERCDNSMTQHRKSHCGNVAGRHMESSLKDCASFGRSHQGDSGSRTGTPLDHFPNEAWSFGAMRSSCLDEISCVSDHVIGDRNIQHGILKLQNLVRIEHLLQVWSFA